MNSSPITNASIYPSLFRQIICSLCLGFIFTSCVEKIALPSDLNEDDTFSAGDIKYIQVNPIWDEFYGFQTPIEISIGRDGYIFIADSSDHSIFVIEQDGDIPTGFSSLKNLFVNGDLIAPIDVDIDDKMNVLFIDGSQRVFRWNQLWNHTGIKAIAASGIFTNSFHGDSLVDSNTNTWVQFANDPEWTLSETVWDSTNTLIDSLLLPHIIYDGALIKYNYSDVHYENSGLSTFSGISSTEGTANGFIVTDNYFNRIFKILWKRTHKIQLNTGEVFWCHDGLFDRNIQGYGTGAGTVNQPTGVDVDYAGNIYYSQSGNFFGVHKIHQSTGGNYVSTYERFVHEIMEENFFSNPQDIAVDDKQMMYIANTNEREIQVFNSEGDFFRKVGIEEIIVDTTLTIITGTDTTVVDTFLTVELKEELLNPRAVTVDDRGVVYIVDTPTQRIIRYRLSNQLDENLNPIQ